jgi:hypothetical protein
MKRFWALENRHYDVINGSKRALYVYDGYLQYLCSQSRLIMVSYIFRLKSPSDSDHRVASL